MANDIPNVCNLHKPPKFDKVGNCTECIKEGNGALHRFRGVKQSDRRAK